MGASDNVEKNVENIVSGAEEAVENITDGVKNVASDVTEKTTAAVAQATESAKKAIEPYTTGEGAIYGLILVILIAGITVYALYVLVTDVIFKKTKDTIEGTKIPILCNEYRRIPITRFSASGNGQRRSYSFWIYINDMNKYDGLYKHVFHIGDDSNITSASPYVFLDKAENKLYVRFSRSSGTESLNVPLTSIANIPDQQDGDLYKFMQQGTIIKYVPIQRWVHICIVINENVNGGTITSYVDGEISSIVSNDEQRDGSSLAVSVANLDIDKKGDLYVGGTSFGPEGPGFSGLISKVTVYNYDLNQKDVYREYNDGPIDGLLAKLGLGAYGVRSPVYRIV